MTPQDRLKALIKEKCILHGDFLLSSGQRSNIFFDCKRATLDPEGIHLIATLILKIIKRLATEDRRPIDAIGGPTIGADPIVGHVAGLSWVHAGSPVARRPALPACLIGKTRNVGSADPTYAANLCSNRMATR